MSTNPPTPSVFELLDALRKEGWTINVFSSVKANGNWTLNGRHKNSYQWESYECSSLEVLMQEFVKDHPSRLSSSGVSDQPKEEKQKELPL